MPEFTEQFIKMAEKAAIPREWQDGDWFAHWNDRTGEYYTNVYHYCMGEVYDEPVKGDIWLPLPHQSLEMVESKYKGCCFSVLTGDFHKFVSGYRQESTTESSLAELCLAFLYHSKYGKRWTGEDWVKE